MIISPFTSQSGPQWSSWRSTGIGASDSPSIMGESPYGTLFSAWAEKTGLLKREDPNPYALQAMERGKKLEPIARDLVNKRLGKSFTPLNVIHSDYDFIKASLDGWDKSGVFLEAKAPSKVEHAKTLKGKMTDKYRAQVQHQSLITGGPGIFASYYPDFPDGEDLAIVEVQPDLAYQKLLLAKLIEFWQLVQTKTPPTVGPDDLARIVRQLVSLQERLNGTMEALTLFSGALSTQKT